MNEALAGSELFEGLSVGQRDRLQSIASRRELATAEYLFRLGDEADHAFVVVEGQLEFCFPIAFGETIRDVAVESKPPGAALGWSAFVSPHSFTLSARAAEPSAVAAFPRVELARLLEADVSLEHAFMKRVAQIVAARLLKIQALWARELQRSITCGLARPAAGGARARTQTDLSLKQP
jgi:CRP-like cAMP-binding protein